MARDEYINPVRHGVISATATTAAEAGRTGFRGLWKGGLVGLAATVGVTSLAAFGIMTYFGTASLLGAALWGIGATVAFAGLAAVGLPIVGSLIGAGVGIGTLFGLIKGTSRGVSRVNQERGASAMLNAQVEAYRAQNQPQTMIYAPSATNQNSFPAQGSHMNQAGSQISAAEYQGLLASQQLAAAR